MSKFRPLAFILAVTLAVGLMPAAGALAADKVIIGVPTSLNFMEGTESIAAVRMAVDEINAKGGVAVGGKKHMIAVESIDIRDAAKGVPVPEALSGMEKLILEKKPHALVVGPFRSEALTAGMDLLAKYKVPLLGTIAMTPRTEAMVAKNPKYKYIFRVSLDAKYFVGYLAGIMGFLKKQYGFDKVYVMNQDVAWARKTAEIMIKKVFPKMKIQVVGQESFPIGTSDYAPALLKAKLKGTQIILPIFDMPQSGILVKQWKGMKVPAIMAGFISPLAGPAAWKTFEGKIAGALNAVFEIGNIPSAKYPPAKVFYEAYKKKYGKEIQAGHGPAPSYASVYLLKDAIEKAGSLDADKIVAALQKTDAQSVMGRVRFSKGNQVKYGNDPAEKSLGCFFQWQKGGGRLIVYPPALAEGKIELPAGLKPAK